MAEDSQDHSTNSKAGFSHPSQGREAGGRPQGENANRLHSPDLEEKQLLTGGRPGNRYVRIVRPYAREFRRRAPGHLVATERVLRPRGPFGLATETVRRVLIGPRLRTEQEKEERVGKLKGLAIFASDNISSSAYATEEVMRVLALASLGALALSVPITLAIIIILAIVVTSYRQVIRAYPNGGGSYVVAHENLGALAGLAAAAALLTDYILTVAVSVSAGVAAITSAFPELFEQRVLISVAAVFVVTMLNLRGIRESGNVFATPTYVYVVAILGLVGFGLFRMVTGSLPAYTAPPEWLAGQTAHPLTLLLLLRAFASGSVALTGTEAVSNGVPAFKPSEVRNAQVVLVMMGVLFASIFLGISVLSTQLAIVPHPEEVETVVSQLTRTLVGIGPYYYLIQFSTAVLLLLAANTAFNGFPRLASVLANDGYLPSQFQFRGDRLAFSVGIVSLSALSALLIVVFAGSVTSLIPLYTVGVFLAFTLSQAGLVRHWWRLRGEEHGWRQRAAVNTLGAVATGVVAVVVAGSMFMLGAWMVLVLMPVLMAMMWAIERHYRAFKDSLALERPNARLPKPEPPHVVVPVSRLDKAALIALAFARSISPDVTAVHVSTDPEEEKRMKRRWEQWGGEIPLVIVESPYRVLISPLMAYIDALDRQEPKRPITVVLSEFVPRHLWEYILHNQTALRLKIRLFFRRNTIVVDVPYYLGGENEPEHLDDGIGE
ncbi:MAG: APC family permease [Chloroflexi bacterium]|nr:APC family permease [Chloroflexota bacterium]